MWHDGPLVLKTCPVRWLSPAIDAVYGLFHRCYAPTVVGMGTVVWTRTALPEAGALCDQDAWLLAALDYMRDVMTRMESDLAADRAKRKTTDRGERERD